LGWHTIAITFLLAVMKKENIRSIGIFRALYLGDLLCIIPTVRAIRSFYPDATITLIGLPWQTEFADRFTHYFDEFISFPGWPGIPEQETDSEKTLEFLQRIRKENFDLLLQMQGNGEVTNKMCLLWNAKVVAGLRRQNEFVPNPKLFPISEDDDHEILRFLKLLDALNIPRQGTQLEFPLKQKELDDFAKLKNQLGLQSGRYICIHPGARDPKRRWSARNFAIVGRHFAERNYQVVLTGSQDEQQLLAALQSEIPTCINIVERSGNVSLGQLACIINESLLLISNDTGVSHIASGLKKPSVVIFSPYSNIQRWAPLNTELHRSIPVDRSTPEFVINCAEDQLSKFSGQLMDSFR
jgi:ADP-heptose:LPS heptosyltransferase